MFWPSIIQVLDWMINLFVLTPVLICYWCGIFEVYDIYLNSDRNNLLYNSILVTSIGACFYLAYFAYPLVERMVHGLHPNLQHNIVSVTMMVGGVFHMAFWKGVWMFAEVILSDAEWYHEVALLLGCLIVKISTATFPGLNARSLTLYMLGAAITLFFAHVCTVFAWASALFLVARLNLDTAGLHYMFGISTLVIVFLFLMETPLAKLRTRFLIDKRSYGFRTTINASCRQMEVVDKSAAEVSLGTIEREPVETTAAKKSSPRVSWSKYRLKQLFFDDVVVIVLFSVEAFFFGSMWDLFAKAFLTDRIFGAWILTTLGAFLVVVSGSCNVFGGIGMRSDVSDKDKDKDKDKEVDKDEDELDYESSEQGNDCDENYLYHNLYARYYKKYTKGRPACVRQRM